MSDWSSETSRPTSTGDDGSKGPSTFTRARRAYSVASWLNWLWSWLGTKSGIATGVALTGAAGVGTVAITNPHLLGLTKPPAIVVATERWGATSVVYPVRGEDRSGRRMTFDIVSLTSELTWVHGSDRELERDGRPLPEADVLGAVFAAEVVSGLAKSDEIVAVGVASVEGAAAAEAERAERRARTAAGWLAKVVPPATRISTLNLGQFRPGCAATITSGTAWQRPLLVIGVRHREPGASLTEALASALTDKPNLPSPGCYTMLQLSTFR